MPVTVCIFTRQPNHTVDAREGEIYLYFFMPEWWVGYLINYLLTVSIYLYVRAGLENIVVSELVGYYYQYLHTLQ